MNMQFQLIVGYCLIAYIGNFFIFRQRGKEIKGRSDCDHSAMMMSIAWLFSPITFVLIVVLGLLICLNKVFSGESLWD